MPVCQGRATGPGHVQPCPENRNDSTVRSRQGDLFLCDACTEFRFPSTTGASSGTPCPVNTPESVTAKSTDRQSESSAEIDVDEVLCFVKSAFIKGTVDVLKSVALSFYAADDLAAAKAKLHKTVEQIGVDGLPRLKKRTGPSRGKAEIDDIVTIMQLLDESKSFDKLPTYVAVDISRLPTTPVENIDMVSLANKVNQLEQRLTSKYEQLEARLVQLELSLHTADVNVQSHSVVDKYEELESRLAMLEMSHPTTIPYTRQLSAANMVGVQQESFTAAAESNVIETELELTAGIHHNNESSADSDVAGQMNDTKPSEMITFAEQLTTDTSAEAKETWFKPRKRSSKKVVGNATSTDLKPAKVLSARKAVFHVDNLAVSHGTDDVVQYLQKNGITVVTCFTAKSWMNTDCVAMRVCIYASDKGKFLKANHWPSGVIVRPWKFKTKPPSTE